MKVVDTERIGKVITSYLNSVFKFKTGYLVLSPEEVKILFPMYPTLHKKASEVGGAVVWVGVKAGGNCSFDIIYPGKRYVWGLTYAYYIGYFNIDSIMYFEKVVDRLTPRLNCSPQEALRALKQ